MRGGRRRMHDPPNEGERMPSTIGNQVVKRVVKQVVKHHSRLRWSNRWSSRWAKEVHHVGKKTDTEGGDTTAHGRGVGWGGRASREADGVERGVDGGRVRASRVG